MESIQFFNLKESNPRSFASEILDDKRRTKIANVLKDYGKRVQYNVFECELSEKVIRKMVRELLKYVKVEEDSLRLYRVCKECRDNIETYGISTSCIDDKSPIVI